MNSLLLAGALMAFYDASLHVAQYLGVTRPRWGPWFRGDGWQKRYHTFWLCFHTTAGSIVIFGAVVEGGA